MCRNYYYVVVLLGCFLYIFAPTTFADTSQAFQVVKIDPETIVPDWPVRNNAQLAIYKEEVAKALSFAPHQNLAKLRAETFVYAKNILAQGQNHFNLPRRELKVVAWTYEFASMAGQVGNSCRTPFAITLNEIMFLRNHNMFIREIIPHEVAHLLSCQLIGDGDAKHTSIAWRKAMKYLAGYISPTHNLAVYPSCIAYYRMLEVQTNNCESCNKNIFPVCDKYKSGEK